MRSQGPYQQFTIPPQGQVYTTAPMQPPFPLASSMHPQQQFTPQYPIQQPMQMTMPPQQQIQPMPAQQKLISPEKVKKEEEAKQKSGWWNCFSRPQEPEHKEKKKHEVLKEPKQQQFVPYPPQQQIQYQPQPQPQPQPQVITYQQQQQPIMFGQPQGMYISQQPVQYQQMPIQQAPLQQWQGPEYQEYQQYQQYSPQKKEKKEKKEKKDKSKKKEKQ